ncbi:GNAT family N-acetyltransferase [Crassaminicella profunda]|uniref:GNAT family N-acetyltransferase n=1 Tax=Crassaminicella profunda TaxID=1286698 RepID=UPI001CA73A1F|nr:GNAT family N-acetyltransferase [Crassaminicella profunda]QZY54157.1 GNAT family N-acetyltransferase [Crassaminicella profunda]
MNINRHILYDLKKDTIKNINMINFIKNYPIDFVEKIGQSILIKGKSDENWVYISSSSKEEFETLLKKCDDEGYFAVMEDWMIPYIVKDKKIDWQLSCMKLFFPKEKELSKNKYKMIQLSINDAEYIYNHSHYKEYTSIDYIKTRIEKGIALGIYENEKLIAWIMTHDDGAIGFLHVLEEYRNKGYGYYLIGALIQKLREIGEIPFVHIEEDNVKSMNLAIKIGFMKDRRVHWIKRS